MDIDKRQNKTGGFRSHTQKKKSTIHIFSSQKLSRRRLHESYLTFLNFHKFFTDGEKTNKKKRVFVNAMMINYFAALPLRRALPCPANLPCFFILIITVTDGLALFTFLLFLFPV